MIVSRQTAHEEKGFRIETSPLMMVAAVIVQKVVAAVLVEVVRLGLCQDVKMEGRYMVDEDRLCGTLKYGSCRCS